MNSHISSESPITALEANQQDIEKLAKEGGLSLVGKIGGRFFNLMGEIALARFLGPAIFGLYAIGATLVRLIGVFSSLGLHNGVIWFGAPYWGKDSAKLNGILIRSFIISAFSGLGIGCCLFLGAPIIANIYDTPELTIVIRWIAAVFPFLTLLKVASSATRITLKMKYAVLSDDLVQPLIDLILIAVVYVIGAALIGALAAVLISFIISCCLALLYVFRLFFRNKSIKPIYPISYQAMLIYSLPTAFTSVLGSANNWIDRLLVGYFRSSSDVGIFQAASQSSMLFLIILNAVNSIFAPMIADLYHKNEKKRLSELYKISTKWALYLAVPFLISICFAPHEIITTLFGEEYRSGALPMVILNLGQFVNLSTGAVGYLLIMTGNQNLWLKTTMITLIMNVALNSILTPQFGIIGASVATSISVATLYLIGLFYIKTKLGLWPIDRRYTKGLIATIIIICYGLVLNIIPISSNILLIILLIAGSYGLFLICLMLLGLENEDKDLFKMIKRRITR